jgi:hypothetical protein
MTRTSSGIDTLTVDSVNIHGAWTSYFRVGGGEGARGAWRRMVAAGLQHG